MGSIIAFFRSLRGKLILTYTYVTVLALLALEVLLLAVFGLAGGLLRQDAILYLQDILYVLPPQARLYLQPGKEDLAGLQNWLEGVRASGKASLDPQGLLDESAARLVPSDPLVVLSPERIVLAQAPAGESSLVGRPYTPPRDSTGQMVLDRAFSGETHSAHDLSMLNTQGNYFVAVPVMEATEQAPLPGNKPPESSPRLLAVILVTVEPPPPLMTSMWPVLLSGLLATGVLLIVGVAPFGALFGLIMSRDITFRLKTLTRAADAWSEGDFSVQPRDQSQDEIVQLGMRMRHMAERIQALLQTQNELTLMEERNRLARELHDTVKQQAFATLMQVRAAKNMLEDDPAQVRQRLDEAEGLIKTSQQELGRLIAELRPAALEGQGLPAALTGYIESWIQQTRIPASFKVQNERSLPLPVEQALYRVAQEGLSNIARHSQASQVSVSLEYLPGQVRLVVRDNGAGFNPQSPPAQGLGLRIMHERLAALGGQLQFENASETGVILTAAVPLQQMNDLSENSGKEMPHG